MELPEGGTTFPLKSEYDRANHSLEGVRRARPTSALDLQDNDVVTVRAVGEGDRWTTCGQHSMRTHELPRTSMCLSQIEGEGPGLSTLVIDRTTFKSYDDGGVDHITDDWRSSGPPGDSRSWTGATMFSNSDYGKIGGDARSSGSSGSGTRPVSVDISSSKPWDGDEPLTSMYVDETTFV